MSEHARELDAGARFFGVHLVAALMKHADSALRGLPLRFTSDRCHRWLWSREHLARARRKRHAEALGITRFDERRE